MAPLLSGISFISRLSHQVNSRYIRNSKANSRRIINPMSDQDKRTSRRLSGKEPPEAPPPTVAGERTALRSLLATDTARGRAVYGSDASRAWNLDASSCSMSSISFASPNAAATSSSSSSNANSRRAVDLVDGTLFDNNFASVAGDDDEEIDDVDGGAGIKLLVFDELRRMVNKSCVCKHRGSPVKLTQETWRPTCT